MSLLIDGVLSAILSKCQSSKDVAAQETILRDPLQNPLSPQTQAVNPYNELKSLNTVLESVLNGEFCHAQYFRPGAYHTQHHIYSDGGQETCRHE